MIRMFSLFGCLLLGTTAFAQPAAPVAEAEETALARDARGEAAMFRRINALRRSANRSPLRRLAGLDEAARVHSGDLATHGELVHVSARTGTPADRVRATGVTAARIAQNIARQARTRDALRAILASDAHRAQLLDPDFTHIGLAAVRGEQGVYVTQILAIVTPPAEERLPPPAITELEPIAPSVQITSATIPATPTVESAPVQAGPSLAPRAVQAGTTGAVPIGAMPTRAVPAVPPAAVPQGQVPQGQAQQGQAQQPRRVPSIRVPANHRGVAGYWLNQDGRWWYFPVPPGTPPGAIVQPDLRFEGPPPGMQRPTGPVRLQRPNARRAPPAHRAPQPQPPQTQQPGNIYWY